MHETMISFDSTKEMHRSNTEYQYQADIGPETFWHFRPFVHFSKEAYPKTSSVTMTMPEFLLAQRPNSLKQDPKSELVYPTSYYVKMTISKTQSTHVDLWTLFPPPVF